MHVGAFFVRKFYVVVVMINIGKNLAVIKTVLFIVEELSFLLYRNSTQTIIHNYKTLSGRKQSCRVVANWQTGVEEMDSGLSGRNVPLSQSEARTLDI